MKASSSAYDWIYESNPKGGIEYITREFVPNNERSYWVSSGQLVYELKGVSAENYKIKFEFRSIIEQNFLPSEIIGYQIKILG